MLTSEENKRQQLPLYRYFKPPFAAVLFSGDNYW